MGEGWSLDRKDLIYSDTPSTHPDPRMHLKVGHGPFSKKDREEHPELYLPIYPMTHRDPRATLPLAMPDPHNAKDSGK